MCKEVFFLFLASNLNLQESMSLSTCDQCPLVRTGSSYIISSFGLNARDEGKGPLNSLLSTSLYKESPRKVCQQILVGGFQDVN